MGFDDEDWLATCRNHLRQSVNSGYRSKKADHALIVMEEKGHDDIDIKFEAARWDIALSLLKIEEDKKEK